MLDERTYTQWREECCLDWLPPSIAELSVELSSQLIRSAPTPTEGHCIFQAGTALMAGIRLLTSPDFLERPHFTQTAALQLILYGSFFQLRESVRFPRVERPSKTVAALLSFLDSDEHKQLRHALAHQGGDAGETYFYLEADRQSIVYSTRSIRNRGSSEFSMPFIQCVLAADLPWTLYNHAFSIPTAGPIS